MPCPSIFDFQFYLSTLDPDVRYTVSRLTGGVVNVTVRAVKCNGGGDRDRGSFPGHSSLVLKYAPPYVAGVGESAPMTQFRQTIEARALALFLPHVDPPRPSNSISPSKATPSQQSLHPILISSTVLVPTLLHHDAKSHVLVLSDLGTLPNLSDVFVALGGHTPGNPPAAAIAVPSIHTLFESTTSPLNANDVSLFEQLGAKLGMFFQQLHSPASREIVLATAVAATVFDTTSEAEEPTLYWRNPQMRDIVLEHALKPVRKQLALFPDLIGDEEADELCQAVIDDFLRETPEKEQAMVLGDCWTGAVLVDLDIAAATTASRPGVGVIDWEFASVGRGIHGDMSQLMAHLELFRMVAELDDQFSRHRQALDAVMYGLTTHYRANDNQLDQDRDEALNSVNEPRQTQMRSALLSHGAELINCAFWKVWVCTEDNCPATGSEQKTVYACRLVRRMVARGIWFLRHAGGDLDAFTSRENQEQIEEENHKLKAKGRWWLMDLF